MAVGRGGALDSGLLPAHGRKAWRYDARGLGQSGTRRGRSRVTRSCATMRMRGRLHTVARTGAQQRPAGVFTQPCFAIPASSCWIVADDGASIACNWFATAAAARMTRKMLPPASLARSASDQPRRARSTSRGGYLSTPSSPWGVSGMPPVVPGAHARVASSD